MTKSLARSLSRTVIVLALVACTSPETGTASSSPNPDAWPRCYSLRLGEWTAPAGQKVTVTHAPPGLVQLDTVPVRGTSDRVARSLTPAIPVLNAEGRGITPSWARLASDSLELMWSSGYEGVVVTLAETGDSVSGTARTFTDYGAQAFAPTTGRRAVCAPAETKQ